jgi:molecular chaperone DnaJ
MVEEHAFLHRQGSNTASEAEVSFSQAVLGTTVEVETLHGTVTLDVPPGTPDGEQFRLPRKGVPRLDARGVGDHIVVASIRVPSPADLSEEQLELLQRLAEIDGEEVADRGVLDRVRDLFG